jgi:hypothetical protein
MMANNNERNHQLACVDALRCAAYGFDDLARANVACAKTAELLMRIEMEGRNNDK